MKNWKLAIVCLAVLINLVIIQAIMPAAKLHAQASDSINDLSVTTSEACNIKFVVHHLQNGQDVERIEIFKDLTWLQQMGYQGCAGDNNHIFEVM